MSDNFSKYNYKNSAILYLYSKDKDRWIRNHDVADSLKMDRRAIGSVLSLLRNTGHTEHFMTKIKIAKKGKDDRIRSVSELVRYYRLTEKGRKLAEELKKESK